ncbi:restriction endonuclease subunit S [Sphingomonas sp. R86520]|uniref:restriction endonuclease subunit S n=1 Tax=Sphingomonas sp. R86520 TaxID=3093859 RepID=UPI0036D2AC52
MNWRPRTLEDCAKFKSGGTPSKGNSAYWGGDIPWVGSGEMSQSFIYDTQLRLTAEGAENGTRAIPENTVLVVVRGMSLAKEFRIAITRRPMTFNQDVKALQCAEDIDPQFLFYALKARKDYIRDLATEASHGTKKLETSTLNAVKILVPETIEDQRTVAAVARNYDDLIENNRRRTDLLEDAARQLYKEWFVRFRFPGHEHVKIIDGVPEGWARMLVKDAVKRIPAGKLFSQKTVVPTGSVPVLDQGQSGVLGFHDERPSVDASMIDPIIAFANHTCNQRVIHFGFSAIQNVLPYRPSERVPNQIYWLHHATFGLATLNAYKGHWPELMAKYLTVPANPIAVAFSDLVRPMHWQIYLLKRQNEELARARDLLLPKLMSGAIAV